MVSIIQINMTRGELSPLLDARVDLDHYKAGLGLCRNWVPMRFGGITRMPGSVFYGEARYPNRFSRWIGFEFKRSQTYAIEVGHEYMRFWTTEGQVLSGGNPYTITTPYQEADLPFLQYRQSGDVIYIACDGYAPRELRRNSETNWQLIVHLTVDGPYLPVNTTAGTMTPGATTGTMSLTLSNFNIINSGAGFNSGDIGRPIRFLASDGDWRFFRVQSITNTAEVQATLFGADLPNTNATTNFRMGAWSGTSGYPVSVGIFEDRLGWGGTALQPINVWYSVNGDYDNHTVSSPLVDDDAINVRMTGGKLNAVQWLADTADSMIGTEGSLRALGRNDGGAAFGPNNLRQRKESSIPLSYLSPIIVEDMMVAVDIYRTKLYEIGFSEERGGYIGRELSALNEHLVGLGVRDIAYQASPHKILWAATDEGTLLAITYDRDQEVFGVSECTLGGSDPDAPPFVEAVLTLPGQDRDGDEVWLTVRREIDGSVVRYQERLSAFYRAGYTEQDYPIYAHSAGVYSGGLTNSLSGLDHLEGETVGVWAGGVDAGNYVVTGGEITWPTELAATLVVFGLRYESDARTLRLAVETRDGNTLGERVNVSDGYVDVYQTAGLHVGTLYATYPIADEGAVEENPYAPAVLRNGSYPAAMDDSWDNGGVMTVFTNSMHPATVRAMTAIIDVESA